MREGWFSASGVVVRSRRGAQWSGRGWGPVRPQGMVRQVEALDLDGSTAEGRLRGGLWVT
eukprot:1577135-Rhodomonas_salina.1